MLNNTNTYIIELKEKEGLTQTVRQQDSIEQIRVTMEQLKGYLQEKLDM